MRKILSFFSIFVLAFILVACGGVKISFEQDEITIKVGDETTLEPIISDESLDLEWSSSQDSVVSVDQEGQIVGLIVGSSEITVTVKDHDVSAVIKVNVEEYDAEISFEDESVNVAMGSFLTLTPIVTPQRSLTFVWESEDEEVATVDQDGKVTPVAIGTTDITASARGKLATIEVNVVYADPSSVPITGYDSVLVKALSEVQLTATVVPEFAQQGVTWSSSDETIATVDSNGLVEFVGVGEVTVTAAATAKPEVLNTVTFNVGAPDPISITVTAEDDKTDIAVFEGVLLTATVEPSLAGQTVTWSVSDDTVGQVNANGYFTGISEGTVTVYATSTIDDEVIGSIELNVYIPDPETINVEADYSVLMIEEEMEFTVSFLPAAAIQTALFESSDEDVVTVDENGKVVAISAGEAVITIKSEVKTDVSTTYNIKVIEKITEVDASFIYVDEAMEAERFSTITIDSHELIVGINAFTDIIPAFELIEEGSTVKIAAGAYSGNVSIDFNNVTILGPNADINPVTNLEGREEEADLQVHITLGEVENILIKGLKFSGSGQIYSMSPLKDLVFENLYYDDSSVNPAEGVLYLGLSGEEPINENILVKNSSFNDTKGLGYRGIRINNPKDLTVEGCYFYHYFDAIRLEGSENSSWGAETGKGAGANGVLNILNNEFENNGQYPIVVTKYTATEVNITDNYIGVAEGVAGVYGFINLVNYMPGEYQTVVNILRNEFPYCTEYHDIRLKSNGATDEDITYNVHFNIWHQKPFLEDDETYDFHIVEHSAGVPVNAEYNVFLYEGGPLPEFFDSEINYEPYFTTVEELDNYLNSIYVNGDWLGTPAEEVIEYDDKQLVFGERAFANIIDALEAAPEGALIIVLPGIYNNEVIVDKAVKLQTLNADLDPTADDTAFKSGAETATIITNVWAVNASNITIKGFSFTGEARVKSYSATVDAGFSNFLFENNYVYNTAEATIDWAEAGHVTTGSASADAPAPGFISLYPLYTWLYNYQFINNKFQDVSDTHIYMVCAAGAIFKGNIFSGGDRDAIRFDYGAVYGNITFEDNVFEDINYNGIYFRSYVGSAWVTALNANIYNNTFKNIGAAAATETPASTRIGAVSTRGYGEVQDAYFNIKFNVFEECANYISLRDNVTNYENWEPDGVTWAAVIEYNAFIDSGEVDYYFANLLKDSDSETTNTGNVWINHNFYGSSVDESVEITYSQFDFHRTEESNLVVYDTVADLEAAIAALAEE